MLFAVSVVSPPSNPTIGGGFREIAESVHYGLLALGHDSVLTDRLDLDDRRTIVFGANHALHYGLQLPADPIFYNLEQFGDDSPWLANPEFVELFLRYPNWDYSQANIEYLATRGLPRPTYVPIGYVPELTRITPDIEDIDVLLYGMLSERRYAVLRDLHDCGFRVKWLSGALGTSRDAWIARSKVVLNIHYWDAKIFEIARVSYLLANKRAVVSETGTDPALEDGLEAGVAFANYDELVERCVDLLSDETARHELAERGFQAFSARSQVEILDRALLADFDVAAEKAVSPDTACTDVHLDGGHGRGDQGLRERIVLKHKSDREREQLLAVVRRDPEDARSVLFLAETCLQLGDLLNARTWYARRIEMGGHPEEVYYAMYRLAQVIEQLCAAWPDVEDAYLRAWIFRPTRAEPLYRIATAYRQLQRYELGYLYAEQAARMPVPDDDLLVSGEITSIYTWRALDEQAVCASRIGRHAEAFALCRQLLAHPDVPDPDRQRIASNRDMSVPVMLEAAAPYPEALVQSLPADNGTPQVTVTLIAGPDPQTTEQALNSFLNCCLDVSRASRFLVLDTGLSIPDRARLQNRYGFITLTRHKSDDGPEAQFAQLRSQVTDDFWLHLGQDWRFFAPDKYITRLTAVLKAERHVFQVGINFTDATTLTGTTAPEQDTRRAPDAGRYTLTESVAHGPAMYHTTHLDHAIRTRHKKPTTNTRRNTASLDEVLCVQHLQRSTPLS